MLLSGWRALKLSLVLLLQAAQADIQRQMRQAAQDSPAEQRRQERQQVCITHFCANDGVHCLQSAYHVLCDVCKQR